MLTIDNDNTVVTSPPACAGDAICFHGFKTHRCKKCSILMTMPTRDNTWYMNKQS